MLIIFQGIFVYTLFYQVCILGPIDMAHECMLRYNEKVVGILYCIIWGFTVAVQALGLEQLIDRFVTPHNTFEGKFAKILVQDGMEMLCSLVAVVAMLPIHRAERQEVRSMHESDDKSIKKAHLYISGSEIKSTGQESSEKSGGALRRSHLLRKGSTM